MRFLRCFFEFWIFLLFGDGLRGTFFRIEVHGRNWRQCRFVGMGYKQGGSAGYLRHVLTCIADHPVHAVDELLPWNVASKLSPPAG